MKNVFLWWYNDPVKIHSERIKQKYNEFVNDLHYDGLEFPLLEKKLIKLT